MPDVHPSARNAMGNQGPQSAALKRLEKENEELRNLGRELYEAALIGLRSHTSDYWDGGPNPRAAIARYEREIGA